MIKKKYMHKKRLIKFLDKCMYKLTFNCILHFNLNK